MKKVISFIFLARLTLLLNAVERELNSIVENVTLYHSGAMVNRIITDELKQGINEIAFINLSSKIVLSSLKISNKEVTILNKSIIRKLTPEEYMQLLDKKDALNKQMTLIEAKYKEAGFVTKVEDLEKMTAFYSEKMMQIKIGLREIERKIEEAKKLENIELKNNQAAILKLTVFVDGKILAPVKMQYVCGGIGWSPAYDIIAESGSKNSITVKYLAKVMSQTGEDWDNVAVNLSSSFPLELPTNLPKPKKPWVLDGGHYTNNSQQQNIKDEQQIAMLEGVEYEEVSIPSFLKIRTLKNKYSIKSNSTVFTFPIQTVSLPAAYHYYAYPGIDAEVYLVAQVTGWDTLGFIDGIANMTYAGNEVGKSIIKFSESPDTLLLPVGKDNSIYMKRTEIVDKKYFKITSIGKKRIKTLAYQFEMKNNNSFPVQFELVEQIPVSQTKSAEVKFEKTSGGVINNELGEIIWQIELKPGQLISKQLIYTIEMDASYKLYHNHEQSKYNKMKTVRFM